MLGKLNHGSAVPISNSIVKINTDNKDLSISQKMNDLTIGIVIVLYQLFNMTFIQLKLLFDFIKKCRLILRPIIFKLHGLFLVNDDKAIIVLAILE